jgi:rhodanese-related sulfurtransferase
MKKEMMTLKRIILMIVFVCLTSVAAHAGARDISSRDAKALLDKNKNVFLLDVRTPQENSQGRIPGTVLIPISDFERRFGEVPKNRTVIVYCAVGSRSKPVAEFLSQRGYKDVYNMSDGIVGWYRNSFPIQR